MPVAAFCVTGYSTVLLWRNCANKCTMAITPNLSLLYHRNVRVIDVLLTRILLEVSGCAMAFAVIVIVFVQVGIMKPPEDWTLLLAGYLMMAWFSGSLAMTTCACSEMSEVFDRIWHPTAYFMLPICGLSFMVAWLPHWVQKLAVLVPMVNGVEMMRAGYFGHKVVTYYDAPYLAEWCMGLMLFGLSMLKIFARRAEPQ